MVNVNAYSDGRLNANVNRFSNDNVWNAENEHRLVVPKLLFFSSAYGRGVFVSKPFLQAPSCCPISSKSSEIKAYFSSGMSLFSHAICTKNFNLSSLAMVLLNIKIF